MTNSAPINKTFGIQEFVKTENKIYYHQLFNNKSSGRITDLLCAQYKLSSIHELKMRAALLFLQSTSLRLASKDMPEFEPILIESSQTSDLVVISGSFLFPTLAAFSPEAWTSLWKNLLPFATLVEVRVQRETGRVETVIVIKTKAEEAGQKPELKYFEIAANVSRPEIAPQFMELGDIDYQRLLWDEHWKKKNPQVSSGEFLDKQVTQEELREKGSVGIAEGAKSLRISGTPAEKDEVNRISGKFEEEDNSLTRVKGSKSQEDKSVNVISGNNEVEDDIHQLLSGSSETSNNTEDEWDKDPDAAVEEIIKAADELAGTDAIDTEPPDVTLNTRELDKTVDDFLNTVEDGEFGAVVRKAQESAKKLGEENNDKAKAWTESLLKDLIEQKAKLVELSKKMNLTIRQTEEEQRKKANASAEEIRRRDQLIRQKNSSIEHLKEQVIRLGAEVGRLRRTEKSAAGEALYRSKYMETANQLRVLKEEKDTLVRKLEEVRINGGLDAQGKAAPNVASADKVRMHALQQKLDQSNKAIEEQRKLNKQLMDKLAAIDKAGSNSDQLKHKLNQSMKLAAESKKEAEAFRTRFEDTKRDATRLQAEIADLQQKLKVAQSKAKAA